MRMPSKDWPDGKGAKNVLYVAQLLREMLEQQSFESFRVQTLDLVSRIDEVVDLATQVHAKRIRSISINPALEELIWSLESDPIAKTYANDEIEQYKANVGNIQNPNPQQVLDILNNTESLSDRVEIKYRKELEIAFQDTFHFVDEKDKIQKICQALISHLINEGFDRRYILNLVNERFFEKDVKKIERRTLSRFLSSFKVNDRKFDVYIPVSKATHKFVNLLDLSFAEASSRDEVPQPVLVALEEKGGLKSDDQIVKMKVERKDAFSAHEFANELIQSMASLTLLQKESFELISSKFGYVTSPRSINGEVLNREDFAFQRSSDRIHTARAKSLREQAHSLIQNFDRESMDRIIRASASVALARTATSAQNQLVLLWSSIEVLLDDPPDGVARIAHYLDAITPCICLNYPRRYLCAIYDQALPYYKKEMRAALKEVEIEGLDPHTRFAHFVFDKKYKKFQDELSAKMKENPLALFRFWKLFMNFGKTRAFWEAIDAHEKRVRWQIARIYRHRNEFIHAGHSAQYTEPLVLNAFEYFKTALGTIGIRADESSGRSDIDRIVASIAFDYQIFRSKVGSLRKDDKDISGELITQLFKRR